jgi:hypothetical protein
MNENSSANSNATPKSIATNLARGLLHLFTLGTALIGGLWSLLCFASASAARTGAGFFGCGDGVPDPQGAQEATSYGILIASGTVLIVGGIQKALANSR